MGWMTRVQFPAGTMMAFFLFATASRPVLGTYLMCTRGTFCGGKRPGREANQSTLSSAEANNAWNCTSIP